jgi:hypothetical protein
MADTRRYTLIDPAGIEASIAVTPSVFKRDYEPAGWTLGFATDGNREPYSDAALKALEKGAKELTADGKARGIPTFIGPEAPTPDVIVEPEPVKAKRAAKAEA